MPKKKLAYIPSVLDPVIVWKSDQLSWQTHVETLTYYASEGKGYQCTCMQYVIITISLELWFLQDDFVSIIQEIQWMNWKSYTFFYVFFPLKVWIIWSQLYTIQLSKFIINDMIPKITAALNWPLLALRQWSWAIRFLFLKQLIFKTISSFYSNKFSRPPKKLGNKDLEKWNIYIFFRTQVHTGSTQFLPLDPKDLVIRHWHFTRILACLL